MDEFKIPELTPEQEQRRVIVEDLQKLLFGVRHDPRLYRYYVYEHGLLWIHFTDWAGLYDLPLLLEEGLLIRDERHTYQPNGTWQDHFPPTAYRLTQRATDTLDNAGRYIWTGHTKAKKEKAPT